MFHHWPEELGMWVCCDVALTTHVNIICKELLCTIFTRYSPRHTAHVTPHLILPEQSTWRLVLSAFMSFGVSYGWPCSSGCLRFFFLVFHSSEPEGRDLVRRGQEPLLYVAREGIYIAVNQVQGKEFLSACAWKSSATLGSRNFCRSTWMRGLVVE